MEEKERNDLFKICNNLIKKRETKKNNHCDECLAVYQLYRISSDPGSYQKRNNTTLAKAMGISLRVYMMKKRIGKYLHNKRNLRQIILQNSELLNKFKFLYSIATSGKSGAEQEIILRNIITCVKKGKTLKEAINIMETKNQQQNTVTTVPAGKVPVFIDKEIADKAKILDRVGALTLPQRIEHFLFLEAMKMERKEKSILFSW